MHTHPFWEYAVMVVLCLLFAMIGLYWLVNFKQAFRQSLRNEIVRRNIVAWLVICFLSASLSPLSTGFFIMLETYGWLKVIEAHLLITTIDCLIVFNLAWWIAE